MIALIQPHIVLDDNVAFIEGTGISVQQIAYESTALKWNPEAIQVQHPDLSLAQVYAALAYYYDHQTEIDAHGDRDDKQAHSAAMKSSEFPFAQRMRSAGLLRR